MSINLRIIVIKIKLINIYTK